MLPFSRLAPTRPVVILHGLAPAASDDVALLAFKIELTRTTADEEAAEDEIRVTMSEKSEWSAHVLAITQA
jgi:hypothetical protein